jgi:hypothetical protein
MLTYTAHTPCKYELPATYTQSTIENASCNSGNCHCPPASNNRTPAEAHNAKASCWLQLKYNSIPAAELPVPRTTHTAIAQRYASQPCCCCCPATHTTAAAKHGAPCKPTSRQLQGDVSALLSAMFDILLSTSQLWTQKERS